MTSQDVLQKQAEGFSGKVLELSMATRSLAVLNDLYRATGCEGGDEYGLDGVGDAFAHLVPLMTDLAGQAQDHWDNHLWPAMRTRLTERQAEFDAKVAECLAAANNRPAAFIQAGDVAA